MKLNTGEVVVCHDGNVYGITHRTSENYLIGSATRFRGNASKTQRLFKPDGSYAGSDKAKNVSKVL